jgi:hypothetical protein
VSQPWAAAALALAVSACASSAHTWLSADTASISCKRNAANCYEEASAVCPRGFDVLDSQGKQGAVAWSNAYATTVAPTYDGQMLIRCRKPAPVEQRPAASAEANGRRCPAGPDGVYRCE